MVRAVLWLGCFHLNPADVSCGEPRSPVPRIRIDFGERDIVPDHLSHSCLCVVCSSQPQGKKNKSPVECIDFDVTCLQGEEHGFLVCQIHPCTP
jgi:hypothetical protein